MDKHGQTDNGKYNIKWNILKEGCSARTTPHFSDFECVDLGISLDDTNANTYNGEGKFYTHKASLIKEN